MRNLKFICLIALFLLSALFIETSECASTGTQQSYKFIVMGDNRPDFPHAPQPLIFQRIIAEINKIYPDADFVIGTGDFILGTDTKNKEEVQRQFVDFARVIKKLTIPFYPVPGNHDVQYADLYQEFLGRTYYSFDHKGSHFVIINSEESFNTGAQWEWLIKDLESSKAAKHTFAFIHRPIYPHMKENGGFHAALDEETRDKLDELMAKYHVRVVFAAHEHLYHKEIHDGVTYVISGGAGAALYAEPEEGGFHHYLVVEVDGKEVNIDVKKPEPPEEMDLIAKSSSDWLYTEEHPDEAPPKDSASRDWFSLNYDEAGWNKGKAPFGYGDEDRANYSTVLANNSGSYYFRKHFQVDEPGEIPKLTLRVASDNAALVYLNGDAVDKDPAFNTESGPGHEFAYWNREVDVSPSSIVKGENVIAVHLANPPFSSDVYLDVEMSAVKENNTIAEAGPKGRDQSIQSLAPWGAWYVDEGVRDVKRQGFFNDGDEENAFKLAKEYGVDCLPYMMYFKIADCDNPKVEMNIFEKRGRLLILFYNEEDTSQDATIAFKLKSRKIRDIIEEKAVETNLKLVFTSGELKAYELEPEMSLDELGIRRYEIRRRKGLRYLPFEGVGYQEYLVKG